MKVVDTVLRWFVLKGGVTHSLSQNLKRVLLTVRSLSCFFDLHIGDYHPQFLPCGPGWSTSTMWECIIPRTSTSKGSYIPKVPIGVSQIVLLWWILVGGDDQGLSWPVQTWKTEEGNLGTGVGSKTVRKDGLRDVDVWPSQGTLGISTLSTSSSTSPLFLPCGWCRGKGDVSRSNCVLTYPLRFWARLSERRYTLICQIKH